MACNVMHMPSCRPDGIALANAGCEGICYRVPSMDMKCVLCGTHASTALTHVQMIFQLKMKLRSQVRWHVPACGGYLRKPEPAPLEAKLLTLLLPSPVALEVRSILAMLL